MLISYPYDSIIFSNVDNFMSCFPFSSWERYGGAMPVILSTSSNVNFLSFLIIFKESAHQRLLLKLMLSSLLVNLFSSCLPDICLSNSLVFLEHLYLFVVPFCLKFHTHPSLLLKHIPHHHPYVFRL